MSSYYDTEEFVRSKKPGELRISKRVDPMVNQRYGAMRLEDGDGYECAVEKGELVLRQTPSGTRQIKARFFETNRQILVMTLQRWNANKNTPGPAAFPLVGREIAALLEFIQDVQRVRLPSGRVVVEPGALDHPQFTDEHLLHAMRGKADVLREILRTDATVGDVKAWGYRRNALQLFERMLTDDQFFDHEREHVPNKSSERVWQNFFEANKWIFGYGLSYIFLSSVDPNHLQNAVAGYSVAWKGSQPDAVMKTRGAISGLCLVEIKTHRTDLVQSSPARSGAYSVSADLQDAVSQSQSSVLKAERELRESFVPKDKAGDPISERIYNYRPRALLVAGRLSQFKINGLNEEKYSSFEMFRRNLMTPEIVTFDELYERARFIVEHTDES